MIICLPEAKGEENFESLLDVLGESLRIVCREGVLGTGVLLSAPFLLWLISTNGLRFFGTNVSVRILASTFPTSLTPLSERFSIRLDISVTVISP